MVADGSAARLGGVSELAPVASLLADRTRARILEELLGGVPLPDGALAARVGVAPSTASEHVSKLEAAQLVVVTPNGRRRDVALAGPHVAEALEALSRLADPPPAVGLRAVNRREALRHAAAATTTSPAGSAPLWRTRSSPAGRSPRPTGPSRSPATTSSSPRSTSTWTRSASAAARSCERAATGPSAARTSRSALGNALLDGMLERGWLRRRRDGRALDVTPAGETGLARAGLTLNGSR